MQENIRRFGREHGQVYRLSASAGAENVYAVDWGESLLHSTLKGNPKVVSL
ncbi:MAG: hypothetical protein ACLS4Z_09880 [Christensenellaceae bacterium]